MFRLVKEEFLRTQTKYCGEEEEDEKDEKVEEVDEEADEEAEEEEEDESWIKELFKRITLLFSVVVIKRFEFNSGLDL